MPKKKVKKPLRVRRPAAKPKSKAKRKVKGMGPLVHMGGTIGGLIAPGIGSSVGRALGLGAQRLYNYISGSGSYTIRENTLMGVTNVPSFGETTIRMRAREYLGDVFGTIGFANTSYAINPGNAVTFPWLSRVASQFQVYKLHGLIFEFVSTSSNALASTNTALGKVVMATSYDVGELPFPDVKSALVTQFANMGKPADNLVHAVECRRSSAPLDVLYVRNDSTTVDDPKFYDYGSFQLITEGMQASADIGGLWVSYDVTLSKPTLEGLTAFIPSQMWRLNGMSGGMFVTTSNSPQPGSPSTYVDPVSTSSTNSYVEILNPVIGDIYEVTVYATGPTTASTSFSLVSYATSGCHVSGEIPFYQFPNSLVVAGTPISSAWWSVRFKIDSTVGSTFPFVGLGIIQSNSYPGGWTGYLLVTKLNPALPVDVFPTVVLTDQSRRERHSIAFKSALERKLEVFSDVPSEAPSLVRAPAAGISSASAQTVSRSLSPSKWPQ